MTLAELLQSAILDQVGETTLLFTDIEGSTRLLHELGPAYAAALAEHRRVLRAAFAANGGREVDTQGDAFFYAFDGAPDAIAAALDGQAALAGGPITVRMGVHTGAPTRTDEGYVGLDVHFGARIAAVGHGGQVVLSEATRDRVEGIEVRDLGEHRLKDFDEPVWIYQLGDEAFPPLKTISNTNLPRPRSSFVGREREVAEVRRLVRENGLVTLTGPGGSGKTRLSIEAAAELVGDFKNGVFWVGLATVSDPGGVLPLVAETLGPKGDLADHIGERELLLLLDNLEQVIDVAPELADLVEACANLKVLVTSRELLRVRGEVEYEVLPLADPEAVELFCLRANATATSAIEELCRRLDNMPLALELAAARTKALSPEQILDRLGERLDLFKGGRDAEQRQATLRATIEWSYHLLGAEEQALFGALGVFVGGSTFEAAEAVCDADLDRIQSLVEKSLVRHTDERFWMLETIREYAVERVDVSGDGDVLRRLHAEYFLALAETASLSAESEGPERPEVVRPELDNIRAAIDWAVGHDPGLAFRLAIAMEQFWVMTDPFEGIRRLCAVIDRGEGVPPVLLARARRTLAESMWVSGDFEGGMRLMGEVLEEFERLGDRGAVAVILHRLSVGAVMAQDFPRARRLLEQSLAICRQIPNPKLEADAAHKFAWVERGEGNREHALELFKESARRCGEVGFTWMQVNAMLDIAELSSELGQSEVGETWAREALQLAEQLSDRQFLVYALAALARFATQRGDVERAGHLWGAIEVEEARGPIGQWENERDQYAAAMLDAGPEFEAARSAGRTLTRTEAIEYAIAGKNEPVRSSRRVST
jgi:predicted ATPase/class 3 adenylate cyclase